MYSDFNSFDELHGIIDSQPPVNAELSAVYKRSFAYHTFRERFSKILDDIIYNLKIRVNELVCCYGPDAKWDSKRVISALKRLEDGMQKNKEFEIFYGDETDIKRWNTFLNGLPEHKRKWYSACWLYAENYFYRRVAYFFQRTKTLKSYDCFEMDKKIALFQIKSTMEAVIESTRRLPCKENIFVRLLKLQLWGNRCDLSITKQQHRKDIYEQIEVYDPFVLVNEGRAVWKCLTQADTSRPIIVDIICDNAGFELFADLIMAEYIIDNHLAVKVRFHVKAMPWYVSDVTHNDYHHTLRFLRQANSPLLKRFGRKLTKYMNEDKIVLEPAHYFWTCPYEFYKMRDISPCLYVKLADATLLIIKGDLNYRKLIGDYNWNTKETFENCIKTFRPTSICALRTIKADLACGLPINCAADLTVQHLGIDWMLSGEYAVIQFAKKSF